MFIWNDLPKHKDKEYDTDDQNQHVFEPIIFEMIVESLFCYFVIQKYSYNLLYPRWLFRLA